MTDSVSFKAYLKRDGQEVEVRRFGIDSGAATNYLYLRSKVQAIFPSVQNDDFNVFWQDVDNDYITISSDEELLEALTASSAQPIKLYIHVKAGEQAQGSSSQQAHSGVVCDACEGSVTGYRYKCMTCPDFDLCAACEAAGHHPEHLMLRMSSPINNFAHPKFFRKFFNRAHKFSKHHGWNRMGEESQYPPSGGAGRHCPYSRRQGQNMFDFSALMEFIESLGVNMATGGERPAAEATASAQASSSTQAPPPSQHPESQGPTPGSAAPGGRTSSGPEYLNGIGHAIAAFLDPFGIDVTFDVRSKPTGAEEPAAPTTATPPQTTPVPAPQTTPAPAPQTTPAPAPQSIPAPAPQSTPAPIPQPTPAPAFQSILFPASRIAPNAAFQTTPALAPQSTPAPAPQSTPAPISQPNPAPVPQTTQGVWFKGNAMPAFIASLQSEAAAVSATEQARESSPILTRRNSDDWTMINRESPTRSDVAMEVDENRGVKPKAPVYPELPKETPSAPPQSDSGLSDSERIRIQQAMESIRSMGFTVEPAQLSDLLRRQNCDIASVLELILSNGKK